MLVGFLLCLLQLLPHHFNLIKVQTLTRLFQNINFIILFYSLVERLVCLGSLSCCMACFLLRLSSRTDVLIFSFRICWYNSKFIVPSMMASRAGPDAAKQAQVLSPCTRNAIFPDGLHSGAGKPRTLHAAESRKYDHITPILQSLHWLPIKFRISY